MQTNIFSPKIIVGLLIAYIASAGITYALVPEQSGLLVSPGAAGQPNSDKTAKPGSFGQFANEPKTEICPLNGKLYSKSEKALWETRRPILAMIENQIDSRPQSGLTMADIVYEAVAEGGITRFMGVFYCGAQSDTARVAPVRSARIYFVNIAAEYNQPIYMHVGGANCGRDEGTGQCVSNPKSFAIEELAKLGWRKPKGNDFDTTGDIGVPVMKRDYDRIPGKEVATEHTYVGYLPYAWKEAEKRGFTAMMADTTKWISGFTPWKATNNSEIKGTPATDINFEFWPGANNKNYAVQWKYDAAKKLYLRNTAGVPHIDLDTNQQISTSNVVIQYVKETNLNDYGKHMYYDVIGSGTGVVFQNGVATDINWKKSSQKTRTIFTDKQGKEINFIPGTIWVELVPTTSKVSFL